MKPFTSKLTFFIATTLFSPATLLASGDHAAPEGSTRFGPGMAVTAHNPEEGFKMSDKALQSLGVTFKKAAGASPWSVPEAALVRIKQSTGVYRRYDGWITFVLVKVIQKTADGVAITSEDIQAGDEVAVTGASFLRMTDADLNSGTVDSCAH